MEGCRYWMDNVEGMSWSYIDMSPSRFYASPCCSIDRLQTADDGKGNNAKPSLVCR